MEEYALTMMVLTNSAATARILLLEKIVKSICAMVLNVEMMEFV